jgi:predicted dehydrogenase
MHIVLVGAGHIGQRHAINVLAHPDVSRLTVVDPTPGPLPDDPRLTICDSIDASPDGILVATPTATHADVIKGLPYPTAPVLVEKPLAHDLDSAKSITGDNIHVAYSMRFHPAISAIHTCVTAGLIGQPLIATARVGQYLPDWHPGEDYQQHYVAHHDQGGGALVDLSHEIDYLNWMFGPLAWDDGMEYFNRHPHLQMTGDQLAWVVMEPADGGLVCMATMDLLDRSYYRHVRIVGSDATIDWRHGDRGVTINGEVARSLTANELDRNYQFQAEINAWLHGIQSGDYGDLCTFEEAMQVMEIIG